jgi:hypothetical protein
MLQRFFKRFFRGSYRRSSRRPEIWTAPWTAFLHETEAASHLFAVGDVHGCDDLLAPLIDYLAAEDHAAQTKIVFTGDLIDRGPGSIRALSLAQNCEERFGRTILLPGNHEIALLEALSASGANAVVRTWIDMGGGAVLREIGAGRLPWTEQCKCCVKLYLPAWRSSYGRLQDGIRMVTSCSSMQGFRLGGTDRTSWLKARLTETPWLGHWSTIRQPFLRWRGGWTEPVRPTERSSFMGTHR